MRTDAFRFLSSTIAATITMASGGSALAQAMDDLQLEEVVVTAERTQRSLKDTTTSVTVLDQQALDERGMDSLDEIVSRLSNVVSFGSSNFLPAVRGVDGTGPAEGASAFLGGQRTRIQYQLDGRALSYNEAVFANTGIYDTQQVEVLRGAQSLLQGRNSIGGVISIKSKDPTFDYQAGARFSAGNYDAQRESAYISGPLVDDQLAFRVAVDHKTYESPNDMPVYDRFYSDNPGDTREQQLGILFGDPSGFVTDPEQFKTTMARAKLLYRPSGLDTFSAMLTVTHLDASGPQFEYVSAPFEERRQGFTPVALFKPKSTAGTLTTAWDINDHVTFETTTSYADVEVRRLTGAGFGNVDQQGSEVTFEPRIRFNAADGALSGLVGVYYFNEDRDEPLDIFGADFFRDRTETLAGFAEATYAVTDRLLLTLGGRFERENHQRAGAAGPFVIDVDDTYDKFLPKAVVAYDMTDQLRVGVSAGRGYNGGGAAFTAEFPFVSYSYKPESVTNYEAFFRGEYFDRRLSVSGNLFFSRYQDYQLPYDQNPDPIITSMIILNADEIETMGAELSARALLFAGLSAYVDLGYLDSEISKYPGQPTEGNELPRAPHLTAQVGLTYRASEQLSMSFNAHYSGSYYPTIFNLQRDRTSSFTIADLQASYAIGQHRIFGYVNNVFDKFQPLLRDDTVAVLAAPRTYMIGIELNF